MAKPSQSWLLVIKIAWRNFDTRKREGGLSFMTYDSLAGVFLGVMTLVVVLSVMGGI